ncbi:MAG: hypothetical protein ACPGXK_09935, partial [Phycisphaerae bacterium]
MIDKVETWKKPNRPMPEREPINRNTTTQSPPLARPIAVIMSITLCLSLAGCSINTTPRHPMHFHARQLELQRDAHAEFARADYFKPKPDQLGGRLDQWAPLIVQQNDATPPENPIDRFGIVYEDDDELGVDSSAATVYAMEQTLQFAGGPAHASAYWWRYENARNWQGFAVITIDKEKPITWFPLYCGARQCPYGQQTDVAERPVFVASNCEQAMREAGEETAEGRLFAVDVPLEISRETYVARLVESGPLPMGPIVYLQHQNGAAESATQTTNGNGSASTALPNLRVSSILCRCMPSQAYEYVSENWYTMRPLDDLPPAWANRLIQEMNRTINGSGLSDRLVACREAKKTSATAPRTT